MFFFRAVIHLLIRSKIYQYIAYQRMAGNQLKKFLPVQRYFSPWKWKYNLHTTEFVFPITVKVTEPLRFFFCRFLLESAAGLFLVCVAAPRLSIWIFTFQKFRLEVLAVKYAPRKVYIKVMVSPIPLNKIGIVNKNDFFNHEKSRRVLIRSFSV